MHDRRVRGGRIVAATLVAVAFLASVGIAATILRGGQPRADGSFGAIASASLVAPSAITSRPTVTGPIHDYLGVADGSSDVTEDLQRFIDAVPDGSVIRFRPAGVYRLDCTVWVRHRQGLTFEGRGSRFFVPDGVDCPSQTIWRFNAGGGHVIRDMTIEGNHPAPGTYQPPHEFEVGIETLGTVGVEIANVTMRRTYGDCVQVGYDNQPGGRLEWSESVWVHGLDCAGNGRQGVAVTGGRNVLIEQSRFADQAYVVFDIEPDEPPNGADGVTIRDNVISGRVDSPMLSIGGAGDVSDVLVERNRVLNGANHGIWTVIEQREGHRPHNVVVRDNVGERAFTIPRSALFQVRGADDITISGNRQPILSIPPVLVDVAESCAVTVADNGPLGFVQIQPEPATCH